MRLYLLAAVLLAAGFEPGDAQAPVADKVVVIRSDFGQGRSGIGTGFFISADGRVLTAYHVIQGARSLTVTHHGTPYPNVVIEQISPDRDLATLKVGPLKGATPFLPLATALPAGVDNETLKIVGHPDGNLYSSLDTKMTSPGFRPSGTIRVAGQAPVFRLTDVDLIPLAGIVMSGMSGAPVVSSRGVIGVLSGSRDEGGTLAWAIPAKYLGDPTMRAVNKPASGVGTWDELRLMISRWKNLRHSIRLDDRLLTGLNDMFAAIEAIRVGNEQVIEGVEASLASIQMVRALAQERVRQGQNFQDRDSVLLNRLEQRIMAVVTNGNASLEARTRAESKLIELKLLIEGHQSALPNTQRNDSLLESFRIQMAALERRVGKGDTALQKTREGFARGLVPIIATLTTVPETAAGALTVLPEVEKFFIGMVNEEARLTMGAEAHLLSETAALLERMLTADYDDNDSNWRWSSGLGYELTIPARWEQVPRGVQGTAFAGVASQMEQQRITLDRVFRRAPEVGSDSASEAAMLVVGRSQAPAPRTAFDSLTGGVAAQAQAAGQEVERVRTPELDALITRGLIVTGNRRILRCTAFIFGPPRPIAVIMILPADRHDLLPHCKSIVESATFR